MNRKADRFQEEVISRSFFSERRCY